MRCYQTLVFLWMAGFGVSHGCGGSVESGHSACGSASQCPTAACADGGCQRPTCTDLTQNGDETDLDCGGESCPACANGEDCLQNIDCDSGFCDPSATTDAGGSDGAGGTSSAAPGLCAPCTMHEQCDGGAHCDFDAGACVPYKSLGDGCSSEDECGSGHCSDGFCCDAACEQTCASCALADTGLGNGTCAAVTAGTDPASECFANTEACLAEHCSGTVGHCAPLDAGTVCRSGSGDSCDPDETCSGSAGQPCPPDDVTTAGTVCRSGSGDSCDPDETCSGSAGQPCPPDDVAAAGTVCRASSDLCDLEETCNGLAGQGCPTDDVAATGTLCRPAAGVCDIAESCDGVSAACPADELAAAGSWCGGPPPPPGCVPGVCTGWSAVCGPPGPCDPF